MARKVSHSTAGRLWRWFFWLAAAAAGILACPAASPIAWAQEFTVSANVDKTSVDVGDPVQLTLTLGGDLSGVELPPLQFPDGFLVAARSQATNVSFRAGAMQRSTSLVFVLVPQEAGTFHLGPFEVSHKQQVVKTEPIEITVKKSALPPNPPPQGERFTL